MQSERRALVTLGKRIRELRERAQMSQEELAEAAKFHRTYISFVERGQRNLSYLNLRRFAKALRVPPSDLIADL